MGVYKWVLAVVAMVPMAKEVPLMVNCRVQQMNVVIANIILLHHCEAQMKRLLNQLQQRSLG